MNEGLRRIAIVIKWLSGLWIAICAVFVVWGFLSKNAQLNALAMEWLGFMLWGVGGFVIAWIVAGFAVRNRDS